MKLITELNESVQFLKENKDGRPQYFIEGIFIQAEKKNKNGRVYPKEILEKEVGKYVTQLVDKKKQLSMQELIAKELADIERERI